jgi:ferredoxin-NADP reductase
MTSLQLLSWIAGSILLQLAIYAGIGFWRHWMAYLALRQKAVELDIPLMTAPTPPGDEMTVGVPAWSGWRTLKVRAKVLEDTAKSVCSFDLVPVDGVPLPAFLPGQFLTFSLDAPSGSDAAHKLVRCYSLSDATHPDHYRVSIKRAVAPDNRAWPPGRASNYFHDVVQVGSVLQVRAPSGHFYLDASDAPVVLIGGGIGITPMLSMLNHCAAVQPHREVWLFYGVRHSAELIMTEHLEAWAASQPNFNLHLCLSDPTPQDLAGQDHRLRGRIDVDLLRRLLPLKPYHFYICGPTPLLQSLVPALEDWGVPDSHIHFEAFGPASVPRKNRSASSSPVSASDSSPDADVMVTFAKSGKTLPWRASAGTLLDLAESNGISVSSGCRAGGCGSCQTTIRSGQVAYQQTPDYDPDAGTCLLCVCAPKTSVTLEA